MWKQKNRSCLDGLALVHNATISATSTDEIPSSYKSGPIFVIAVRLPDLLSPRPTYDSYHQTVTFHARLATPLGLYVDSSTSTTHLRESKNMHQLCTSRFSPDPAVTV